MYLKRIVVPDFRVLKDVDISFEPDLVPRIFPLGSLNGGGKSTLLQLIFTLLHCPGKSNRLPYLQNMLDGFEIDPELGHRLLASIELILDDRELKLDFVCYDLKYVIEHIDGQLDSENMFEEIAKTDKDALKRLLSVHQFTHEKNDILNTCIFNNIYYLILGSIKTGVLLFCKSQSIDIDRTNIFDLISNNVFLTAPVTQVFRFLADIDRSLLFKETKDTNTYYHRINKAKSDLVGFLPYDFLAVNLLVDSFKKARDNDFKKAISTGKYGNIYQDLIKELEHVLQDKKVNIDLDLQGVNFSKIDSFGKEIKLYPEDLSHGELKRLSLYLWLKYSNIDNAIVLMDEVEIALHPDWQYGIINDLQTWAPNNQYILATHSYELCQALTPAHVKEIEPKLLKQNQEK
jgi:ABC-type dipeptide/oligopeptide/nickel transport system ATPase component